MANINHSREHFTYLHAPPPPFFPRFIFLVFFASDLAVCLVVLGGWLTWFTLVSFVSVSVSAVCCRCLCRCLCLCLCLCLCGDALPLAPCLVLCSAVFRECSPMTVHHIGSSDSRAQSRRLAPPCTTHSLSRPKRPWRLWNKGLLTGPGHRHIGVFFRNALCLCGCVCLCQRVSVGVWGCVCLFVSLDLFLSLNLPLCVLV